MTTSQVHSVQGLKLYEALVGLEGQEHPDVHGDPGFSIRTLSSPHLSGGLMLWLIAVPHADAQHSAQHRIIFELF